MLKKFSPEEHIKKLTPLSENKSERDAWNQLLELRKKEEAEQGYSESALFQYRDDERSIAVFPMEVKMWTTGKKPNKTQSTLPPPMQIKRNF